MSKSLKKKRKIRFFDSVKWERIKFGQLDKPFFTFISMWISMGVGFALIYYFSWLYRTTGNIPLENIIVIILAFQVFFMLLQTINIMSQSKLAKLSNLPHIHVWIERPKSKKYFVIKLQNNGTDAVNVSYKINTSWFVEKDIIKDASSVFSLPNKDKKQLGQFDIEEYRNKQLYIRVWYEDLLNNKYFAVYKKKVDELSLVNITTGLY